MRMAFTSLALAAFVVPAVPARSDEAPEPATPPLATTTVAGSIPDLTGRWLVVAEVTPQGGQTIIPVAYGLEVVTRDGQPAVTYRWGGIPPEIQASLDAATTKNEAWHPTPAQLDAIGHGWDKIAPDASAIASTETTISGPDAEPAVLKDDPKLSRALFTVQSTVTFQPGGGRPARNVTVMAIKETTPNGYRGNYLNTMVAAAPFPIPIAFSGTFTLNRLAAPPQPGLLHRLLDAFSGCGRRARS